MTHILCQAEGEVAEARSSQTRFASSTTTVNHTPARTVEDELDEVEAQPTVRTVRLAIDRPLCGCLRGRARFE